LPIWHPTLPPVQWHSAMQLEGIKLKCWWHTIGWHVVVASMNNAFCFVGARWYESFALSGFKDLHFIWVWIPHIPFKWMHHTYRNIVWNLNIDSALFTLQPYIQFFLQKALISIWMPSLPTHHWLCIITSRTSLQHVWTAPTNTWYHYLLSCFQARIVVIMEKERCHGCDKWFAWIEQHLTYHNHCRSVMVEHARQQRLVVKCRNRNNGMNPLIGTIVVGSAHEVDGGMSTGMSTRGAWQF
jgi:hypothetical protein